MKVQRCSSCRFWERQDLPDKQGVGFCRRQSPVVVASASVPNRSFPWTWGSLDWCGEWRGKGGSEVARRRCET